MKESLKKIIGKYGVIPQLEYLYTEMWELTEAIKERDNLPDREEVDGELFGMNLSIDMAEEHIKEEIADNFVMLYQFPIHYLELIDDNEYIAEFVYRSDSVEHIDDIKKYSKDMQKDLCRLTRCIAILEERDQDYLCQRQYEELEPLVKTIMYKLESIAAYYEIGMYSIKEVMDYKIERQLERIKKGK